MVLPMKKAWVRSLLAVVLVLGTAAGGWLMWAQRPYVPLWLEGTGGDFRLASESGPVNLHDFRGKVVLVYFGYTHCPDACPAALGTIGSAMQQLTGTRGRRVAGLFVSLDPRRDTPKVLKAYARFFDTRLIGLTGSAGELEKVAAAWRVSYSVPDAPPDANYAVEHSTFIYLVNPEGRVAALFDEKTDPAEIARAIRQWL